MGLIFMNIDFSSSAQFRPFNKHWQFCTGSAHAAYALRRDWAEQLKTVHDELGIRQVRFHGIFCDDMHTLTSFRDILPVPFTGRITEQTFRQCAAVYDNILSAGMKPFVELSFMPKKLSMLPHIPGAFYYRPNVSMPKSLKRWCEYIKDFIRFLIDRYGREEVESWHFEVWNEPDLPVVFFDAGQKSYFKLYAATARAIKSVDKALKVGGPATSGSRWIAEFIQFCKAYRVPLDFISTHQYAGDPIGGVSARGEFADDGENTASPVSIDFLQLFKKENRKLSLLEVYRKFMNTASAPKTLGRDTFIKSAANVKALAGTLPVYYTEWNMCAAFSAPCNDTSMQAAYILHAVFGTQQSIDGSSIWAFSDLFEEFHQFPEEFHGGFGLLTQSGIKKPSYHALEALCRAGDEICVLPSENSKLDAAVIKKENSLTLVLSYLEFEPCGKAENINISLALPAEPEKVSVLRIDEEHANPFKVWRGCGAKEVPNCEECEKIKRLSAPKREELEYTFADGVLNAGITLPENGICFIGIELKK